MSDLVNHPSHYVNASVRLEPIDVLRYAPFDLGNALKYILRAPYKGNALLDYQKARKYLEWAKEGYINGDYKPYQKFLDRYGMLLQKFDALQYIDLYNVDNLIGSSIEFVESKIKELQK